ncbi:MAG TPA: DUF3618 domain-containing protein [Vicinamibacterales bacterium]|nr:DUF3618 domain-containing protein [Vicinamibacterales bacterium]
MAEDFDSLKSEIAKTRTDMSETLGEIQDRLRPDHLLQQARDGVTHAAAGKVKTMMNSAGDTASVIAARARNAGTYVADYASTHPLYVAIAVGAATWWMLRGRERSDMWYGASDTQWSEADEAAYNESRSLRDKVGGVATTARETVGEYATSARETVGEYAESARLAARRASERARTAASTATTTVDDWVRTNPLAAGAVAIAVGAAVGLSVPRTEWEDTTMGEARDRAWEKAARAAQNLKENVTEKVTTAAETLVGESITNAATTPPNEPMGRV